MKSVRILTVEEAKAEIKVHLDQIIKIALNAQESFKLVRILVREETDKDLRHMKANTYFRFTSAVHWSMTVIEITKLITGRSEQHYDLSAFMNRFEREYKVVGLSRDLRKRWKDKLKAEHTFIENLVLQRNSIYAHTDPDSASIPNLVTIGKMDEFITFLQDFIEGVSREIFENSYEIKGILNSPARELERVLNLANYGGKRIIIDRYGADAEKHGLTNELPTL